MSNYKSINDSNIKLEWCKAIMHKPLDYNWERVRQTSAYYVGTKVDNDNIILLKSYATIVAMYNKTQDKIIVCNKYSRTTSKHVTEFIRKYATLNTQIHFIEY
jgi:hypothetical protein